MFEPLIELLLFTILKLVVEGERSLKNPKMTTILHKLLVLICKRLKNARNVIKMRIEI